MADQAVIDMKLDQRGFVMTRYGALISTTGNAANAKDNPLFIQTAGGDLHFANDAEPQGMPEEGSLKDLFGGQEMLVSGPASATDRWRDEGARDRMVWQLAYPAGNVDPLYTGERKVIGPAELPDEGKSKAIMERERKNRELVREAELAIRYLQPAEVNPLSGPLVLLKKEEGGTGTFGYSRMDEFGNPKKHGGVDLVAPEGSPVYAIKPGEVIIERKSETYGYQVIIDHGNRLYSQYAHMDGKIVRRKNQSGGSDLVFVFKDKDGQAKELKSGDSVMAGTQIGAVGHTGNAGGGKAHLHLEIRYGNNGVDPNTRVLINPMYFLR
jgi:murein DD-endopeptidase MepM/ murein hydrolase activator NlpD